MVMATAGASRVTAEHNERGEVNVGSAERAVSAVAGVALAVYGLRRRDLPGLGLALAGAEMMHRGGSGHCIAYQALGVSTADSTTPHPVGNGVSSRAATVNARHAIKVERSITVLRPAQELYSLWRNFENLPRFMRHLVSVTCTDAQHSHWTARITGDRTVEWDAEIVNDLPGELIAWKTVGNPDVAHAGSVHFRNAPGGGTEVKVVMDYEPPAHGVAARIAKLFGQSPDQLLREDLRRFKEMTESGEAAAVPGPSSTPA